ncbi:MAG TPA: hypothetical protein VM029_15225, partial [Opitutaceae bacterium]|nr:hypothetical protein [Opitutaceae bacterium]
MNWTLAPFWSLRAIAALALVLIACAVFRWWRERRGLGTTLARIVMLSLLAAICLNPQRLLPRERTGRPKLAVLLDTS